MEAGLANAGQFRAWVSDGVSSPSQWNPHAEGLFVLLSATTVATSWAALTDGSLDAKLDVLENGDPLDDPPFYAWTGANAAGQAPAANCAGWSDGTESSLGIQGNLLATDATWSEFEVHECWTTGRLICVEK